MTFHPHDANDPPPGPETPMMKETPSADAAARCCDQASRVQALHDGELYDDEIAAVRAHLAECPECAQSLAFLQSVTGRFDAVERPRLSAEASARLNRRLEAAGAFAIRRESADVRWARGLTAVAAIVFFLAAGRVVFDGLHPGAGLGGAGALPAADHRSPDTPRPTAARPHAIGLTDYTPSADRATSPSPADAPDPTDKD